MSTEENKAVVRRFIEDVLGGGNLDLVDDIFAPDYVARSGLGSTLEPGPSGARKAAAGLKIGFPDVRYTVEDLIAEGDKVVVRASWSGTHQGAYGGVPPTGKTVTGTSIHIYRFVDGKIVERWLERDRLDFMQQVGFNPFSDKPL